MAEAPRSTEQFEISRVISRAFDAIGSNLLVFAGLSLIFSGVPGFLINWWQLRLIGTDPDPGFITSWDYWGPLSIGMLLMMVMGAVLQAALTRATVMHLSGERPGFAQCLGVGLSLILPMIAIGFLAAIGVGFATILLIVPGIILWLCWSVTVPAYVQERPGIFGAFGRSLELTRGARWKIFLTMLAIVVGLYILNIPAGMVMMFTRTAAGSPILPAIVQGITAALGSMVMLSTQASIYVELRNVKEGVAPEDLEEIFA